MACLLQVTNTLLLQHFFTFLYSSTSTECGASYEVYLNFDPTFFLCSSEKDRLLWTESVTPPQESSHNPGEKIYETWDCPQVSEVDVEIKSSLCSKPKLHSLVAG